MVDDLAFASEPLPQEDADVLEERRRIVAAQPQAVAARRSSAADSDVIRIVGLRQEYPAAWEPTGKKVALKNLCLGVEQSSCLGLLGHNGAGKSTIFNMLSCGLTPTRGDAYIQGDCFVLAVVRSNIVYRSQHRGRIRHGAAADWRVSSI